MFIDSVVEQKNVALDMFDITINFEDHKNISQKKIRSQRMSAARRAIEKRNESQQLAKDLAELQPLEAYF
ncbi:MAG: gamma-glutamylcysteine synthetase [Oceanospirillaceae bacterium]|jgi:gamma-glutamylcysteine synthetase